MRDLRASFASRRWARWGLIALGYAAVLALIFWRVFLRGRIFGWDCLNEYWPDLVFQSRALHDGQLPLWNPYTLGGYPFYADPQAGLLVPVNWLCVLGSFVFGVGAWMIELKVVVLFYGALLGMHALVWRWTKSHAAAAFAAITFVVGAPVLVHKNSSLVWPLLALPWAVLALDAFLARATPRRGLALGLALGFVGVLHPQGAFYGAMVLACYGLYRLRERIAAAPPRWRALGAELRRLAPGLLVAAAVAGVWLALVYLPSWGIVADSGRAGRTAAWALQDPLTARDLRELFVPALDRNWMHDIYLGPLAVILPLWLAIVRREGRLWLAVAAASVLVAMGSQGHLLPWLAAHAPGFRLFRLAYRYKLITAFACAAAVGAAIGLLAVAELARRQRLALLGLSIAWLACALAIAGRPTWWALVTVLALQAVVFDRAARRRWWLVALVGLALVDLWRASDVELAILQPRPAIEQGRELLARMPGIDRAWRFHVMRHSAPSGTAPLPYHVPLVEDAREISGYEQPLTTQRALDVLAAAKRTPALLTHFNTKYFIGQAPPGAARIPGTPIAVARDVAPVARLYPRAELLPASQMLARLARMAPSALGAALVDPADRPPALPDGNFAPVDGTVVAFERSRLVIDVDAPAAGILVVDEAWAPGWRGRIDGAAAPVFRANYMLRAVVVPAGKHRIELTFAAPTYRDGLVAAAVLALLLVILATRRWQPLDREPGHAPAPPPPP